MKIVNRSTNKVEFRKLSNGEVFRDEHSNYCMKIETNDGVNMVYLSDGALGSAEEFWTVEKVRCELIVDN